MVNDLMCTAFLGPSTYMHVYTVKVSHTKPLTLFIRNETRNFYMETQCLRVRLAQFP